jgi:hypothetical protein
VLAVGLQGIDPGLKETWGEELARAAPFVFDSIVRGLRLTN